MMTAGKKALRLLVTASIALVGSLKVAQPVSASPTESSLDLVILVDESASLSTSDVRAEIRAVQSLVARRELSRDDASTRLITQVAIAGFGSGSEAVDEKCPPIVVKISNVEDLIRCADRVERRTSTGQHTDFAKAFEYASEVFRAQGRKGSVRAVILLTDGKYDPVGKRGTSGLTAADIVTLNSSTAALRSDGAQIWPLGFGQVEEEELNELARSGARSNCPTGRDPYAIVADDETLGDYLLEILDATICVKSGRPEPTPYDYEVHPFVNEVTLTVRGSSTDPQVIVEATAKSLCAGEWKKAQDDSLACTVKVTGTDVGVWKITAPGSASGSTPTVETSQSGRVDLRLVECEATTATISVSRIDGTPIAWNSTGTSGSQFSYPRAIVVDTAIRSEIASTVLSSADRDVTFQASAGQTREIEAALAGAQADFVWLNASVDTCEIGLATTPTTVRQPSTSTPIAEELPNDEGSVFPWLWLLFAILVLGLLLWLARRRSRQGQFPSGTELKQRNIAQNPAANWNTRADLSGLREMRLNVDRNGWLVEAEDENAELIIRRVRSRAEGDFVLIQPARGVDGEAALEGTRASHAFSITGEPGSGISVRNTYIRVDLPEELEEIDEDSDE
jgi:hypothetical protein